MPSVVLSALACLCLGHVTFSLYALSQYLKRDVPPALYPLIQLDSARHAALAWLRWKRTSQREDYEQYLAFRRLAVRPWMINDDQTNDPRHATTADPFHVRV